MSSKSGGVTAVQESRRPHRSSPRPPRPIRFWIGAWWPVALGIAVIATESTAAFGADRTSGPLRALWQLLFGSVSEATWGLLHEFIRKSGHFIGYGLIGVAWLRAWRMTLPRLGFVQHFALAVLGTGLLATWDEWHQSFLPNRGSSPWDVLLDCCGAISLCLVTYLYIRFFRPERLARG